MKALIVQTVSFSLRIEGLKAVVCITAIVCSFSFEMKWFVQHVAFNSTTGAILFPPGY